MVDVSDNQYKKGVGGSQWNNDYCYCSSQLSSMNAKPFLVAVTIYGDGDSYSVIIVLSMCSSHS